MIIVIFIFPGVLYSLININLRNIIHKEVSSKDRILLSLNDFFDWLFFFPCIMIFKNPYTHKINIGISLFGGLYLIFWIINLIENLFVKQKRWYFTSIKLEFILNKIKKNNI